MDEHDSKLFLDAWGIPVTREVIALERRGGRRRCRKLGYPLVMKASAADILHKTGKGLIRLGLKSRDEAVSSYRAHTGGGRGSVPVILYRMVSGDRELVAGIVRTPGFGPSVMFGLGGIFTEALGDTVFRPAPLSEEDAAEMVRGYKVAEAPGPVSRDAGGQYRVPRSRSAQAEPYPDRPSGDRRDRYQPDHH